MSDVAFEILNEEKTPSRRGRKSLSEPDESARAMDLVAAEKEQKELSAKEADELYGGGEEYERLRVMEEVRSYLELSAKAIIETGKRLILIKAHEENGAWLSTLEQMGIDQRFAQRSMYAARKYGQYDNLSHLGYSKLQALEELTEADVEKLDAGDSVAGIDLDDIDRMTAKELRESLRKEREKREKDRKAQDAAIEQKESKINEMENQLRYREPPTARDLAEGALIPIKKDFLDEIGSVDFHLERAIATIDRAQRIDGIKVDQLDAWMGEELIGAMIERLKELYDQIDEAIQNIRPIEPEKE
jgi:hypothetical protein